MNNTLSFKRDQLTDAEKAAIETGLRRDFGIKQVGFNDGNGEPIFTFKEMQLLTVALCEGLDNNEVEPAWTDAQGRINVKVTLTLQHGPSATRTAAVEIGESLGNGETIVTEGQAAGLAVFRAWRAAMSGIGFDLTRTLRERYAVVTQTESFTDEHAALTENSDAIRASRKRAALVSAAIKNGYSTETMAKLFSHHFGTPSVADLTEQQCTDLTALLSADLRLRAYQQRQAA